MNKKKHKDLKKKTNKAVALSYEEGNDAPKVIAKGKGVTAEKIIEKAIEEDITIYEDKKLVESLIGLDINEEIPESLYEAVAEIVFYVYSLDKQRGRFYEK